jgi:hypothetical protein
MSYYVASAPLAYHWSPHGTIQWVITAAVILLVVVVSSVIRRRR